MRSCIASMGNRRWRNRWISGSDRRETRANREGRAGVDGRGDSQGGRGVGVSRPKHERPAALLATTLG
jgi:hypothetical protein